MDLSGIWFVLLAIAAQLLGRGRGHAGGNAANKYFLEKEKFLLEILLRVAEPPMKQEWLSLGESLVLDESQYVTYTEAMADFYAAYRERRLLPRGRRFSPLDPAHERQARGLHDFLHQTLDWETLQANICWARRHANEAMFVHALLRTMLRRDNLRDLILPRIYEILPQRFLPERFTHTAESFDYGTWSRAQQLHAEREQAVSWGRRPCANDICWPWQWWRLAGLDDGVHGVAATSATPLVPWRLEGVRNTTHWRRAMGEVRLLWLPVDYARPRTRTRTSYLTEDVGWNGFWFYANLSPNWASVERAPRLRDRWLWQLQQVVARHRLEAVEEEEEEDRDFGDFEPALIDWNGERIRPEGRLGTDPLATLLDHLLRRVRQALNEQRLKLRDGREISLRNANNFKTILDELSQMLIEGLREGLRFEQPRLLHNYETMLRDPAFYGYGRTLLRAHRLLRSALMPPYQRDDLHLPGVRLEEVLVSPLTTRFELVDVDATALLSNKMSFYEGHLMREKALLARQLRLSHRPFRLVFNISADRPQTVIVRSFLGPSGVVGDRDPLPDDADLSLFQLDTFVANLSAGPNLLQRRSLDFFATSRDHPTQTELYRLVLLALDSDSDPVASSDPYEFPMNISGTASSSSPLGGFPQRLLLPRGSAAGLPLHMFFIASAYRAPSQDSQWDRGRIDDRPFGFPFDRHLQSGALEVPNALGIRVKVHHDDRVRKRL